MSLSDDYSYKIRSLDSRIEDLENDLESLKTSFGYIDDLEHELRSIRSAVSDADDKADEVRSNLEDLDTEARGHIADTGRALKKLTARIQLMEANLAAADKMPRADFDSFPASWRALGVLAGKARAARTMLLTHVERDSNSSSIRSHQEAVEQRNEQYAAVLTAAETLASTAFGTPQHEQASQAFTTARHQADQYARTASHRAPTPGVRGPRWPGTVRRGCAMPSSSPKASRLRSSCTRNCAIASRRRSGPGHCCPCGS